MLKIAPVVILLGVAGAASASSLLSLNAPVTATSYYGQPSTGCGEVFPPGNITNGMYNDSGNTCTSGSADWSFWLGVNGQGSSDAVSIDLGAVYTISDVQIQTTHNRGYNDRGTLTFNLYISSTPVTFGNPATYGTEVVSDGSLSWVSNPTTIPIDDFTISPTDGRYVTLTSLTAHDNNAGLNEIDVYGGPASSTPEPSSWSLAALGLLGAYFSQCALKRAI